MSRPSILIVDDNKTYGRLMSIMLSKEGFKVSVAETVAEAMDDLEAKSFDLIISDLVMPDNDGVDFMSLVKLNPETKSIPIIIMSGYDTQDHVQGLKNLGAYAVLPKSMKDGKIVPTIKQALNLS